MASKKGDYEIPFDRDGNQQHYPERIWVADQGSYEPDWRPNWVFEDTLVYVGFARGRSAAYLLMTVESTGKRVTVFLTDFDKMIDCMEHGRVTGSFTFTKKGMNYGCQLATNQILVPGNRKCLMPL